MGYDIHTLIITAAITAIVSSLLGGSLGGYLVRLIMKNEAKDALKDDLAKIDADIKHIEKNYVTCSVCQATHGSTNKILEDMNKKIDMLLEAQIKKS